MADYRLNGSDESDGVYHRTTGRYIPNSNGNRYWKEYLEWKALGNTPDPRYTLAEAKILCAAKAQSDYESAMDEPYNDGTDDIDCTQKGRLKINGAKASGKTSVKVKKASGKSKSLSETELDDIIDAIDDRDDDLLDDLDTTLDAIEAAETLAELDPYMPVIT